MYVRVTALRAAQNALACRSLPTSAINYSILLRLYSAFSIIRSGKKTDNSHILVKEERSNKQKHNIYGLKTDITSNIY